LVQTAAFWSPFAFLGTARIAAFPSISRRQGTESFGRFPALQREIPE